MAASSSSSSNSSSCCFAFLLLLVLLLLLSSHVNGEQKRSHHKVSIHSLLPTKSCSSSSSSVKQAATSSATRLRVVHRHGPCSPLQGRRQALSPEQILREDLARVDFLHRRISAKLADGILPTAAAAAVAIPVSTSKKVVSGENIVTIGFGTPKQDQTLIIDTGSDVTWIQCRPCVSYCHDQVDALFDPASSSSYSNISCGSAYCSELDVSDCSDDGTCRYDVEYGDGSQTAGFYARETLLMSSGDVIPNFRFGCGQDNAGLFGNADGLLGLGRAAPSLVSQTKQKYGGVFSYCLPSTPSSTGYLSFGGGGNSPSSSSSKVKYTPMLTDPRMPTFYYLNLKGISVAGKLVPVPATVFSKAGTIIDSGTVITRLPPPAYAALRAAFRQAMAGYNYKRAAALSILDTCYDLSGHGEVEVPTVALEFVGNQTVELEASGTLYTANPAQICLAFAANDYDGDVGIIGNVQQRSMEVIYDTAKMTIGFGPGGCD